jgi:cell division transport system ATP-binding protein
MVRLIDVFKEYENGTKALKGVSIVLGEGEFAFLVGPSGSGKTTVIKLLIGEIAPTDGEVMVNGFNLGNMKMSRMPHLRRTLGVIFQDFRLIGKKSAYENIAFAMRAVGASNREIRKRVQYVLDLVGLEKKSKALPRELSGGEQQRVAVARALVNNPRLIIADEPTGNLDPARSLEILTLLNKINELGTTVLIVTHEKALVDKFSKRVIAIDGGRIISDGMDGYYDYYEKQ